MNELIVAILIGSISLTACSNPEIKQEKEQINNEKQIDSLIALMTLEEKVAMIHANSSFTSAGVKRLRYSGAGYVRWATWGA